MNEDDLKNIDIENDEEPKGEVEPSTPVDKPVTDSVAEKPTEEAPMIKVTKHKHWVFIGIASILVVLCGLFWVFKDQVIGYIVKQPVAQVQAPSQSAEVSTIDKQKASDPELAKFITPTTGETWLQQPKDMAPQGWLKDELLSNYKDITSQGSKTLTAQEQLDQNMPSYAEVGSRAGGSIVRVHIPSYGVNGIYVLFEKQADGKVVAVARPQEADTHYTDTVTLLKDSVTAKVSLVDQAIRYDSLNMPAKISLVQGEFATRPTYFGLGVELPAAADSTSTRLVAALGQSALYQTEKKYSDTQLTNIGYYVKTAIGTSVGYVYAPNQESLQGYSFTNGVSLQYKDYDNKLQYDEIQAIARGCGGTAAVVTRSDSLKDADLSEVGKTNEGRVVYEPKDKASALYTKAYQEYKDAYTTDAVSFDDYVKNHGLVVIKNASEESLVYVRQRYSTGGGCAKPVVYLYPTQPTIVQVKVGANVTVSDPFYTSNGWQNVLARPDGRLTYQGKAYDSLFWEGQGVGSYPGIVSGTVVKRADASATIRRQLAEQGLNAKETTDFMAFWENKIPNKPYIRLTWLNTAQMNALAPLSVSPKPDTVIRVFLDMDGFDAPISLPVQKLTKVERKGFTVVEWGGLTSIIK